MIRAVAASNSAAKYVADHIRPIEALECMALEGLTPEEAMMSSLAFSALSWVLIDHDSIPIMVCGVSDMQAKDGTGIPWSLSTPEVEKHSLGVSRIVLLIHEVLERHYDFLTNWVFDENEKAKTWLQWMGYTIDSPEPVGINGERFCGFWRCLNVLCARRVRPSSDGYRHLRERAAKEGRQKGYAD